MQNRKLFACNVKLFLLEKRGKNHRFVVCGICPESGKGQGRNLLRFCGISNLN